MYMKRVHVGLRKFSSHIWYVNLIRMYVSELTLRRVRLSLQKREVTLASWEVSNFHFSITV